MTVSPLGKVFIVCPKSPVRLKKQKNNGMSDRQKFIVL
jgi:hypothetical protein